MFSHVRCLRKRGGHLSTATWDESPLARRAPWIMKKSTKKYRYFFKKSKFSKFSRIKKNQNFRFFGVSKFLIVRFFLDDGKIFFTRNFFSFWIGRPAHVRVGRWRVGFLSVTASESQKYRKRFKIPQNHKTKKNTYRGGSEI